MVDAAEAMFCTTMVEHTPAAEDSASANAHDGYAERLQRALRNAGMGIQALADGMGISYQAVKKVLDGKSKAFSARNNERAASLTGVDAGWLATGQGPMLPEVGSGLEAAFQDVARRYGLNVRQLTPSNADDVPDEIRHAFGRNANYVPDFVVLREGADPLFVEVKGSGRNDVLSVGRYQQLEQMHPDHFRVVQMQFGQPGWGLAKFLREIYREGMDPPEWVSGSPDVIAVPGNHDTYRPGEPRSAFGMAPILAWEHPDDLPEGDFVMVPRLDVHLSAGGGREQVEIDLVKDNPQAFRVEWIRLMRLKPNKLAAMRASGESMEPTIHDGDSLLVDTSQTTVVDNKVYALWYDGGERVKRLFRLPGGGLRIVSDNPKHPTLEVDPDHQEHVRIIGRVVHRSGTGGL